MSPRKMNAMGDQLKKAAKMMMGGKVKKNERWWHGQEDAWRWHG